MTQQQYFLGDLIGYKGAFSSGGLYAYFGGATKIAEGWELLIAFAPLSSGNGGMFTTKQIARSGDVIRLAKQFQLCVDKDGNPNKFKYIPCSELRVNGVEQDCLTVDVFE